MRDLSLTQGFQLTKNSKQARIRRDAALVWAAGVIARVQPRRCLASQHNISRVPQNLVTRVSLQQIDAGGVGLGQCAGALQVSLGIARRHRRSVDLHSHCKEQMGCIRVRTVQEFAGAALCRVIELGSGLVGIGIGRHGAKFSAGRYQEVFYG